MSEIAIQVEHIGKKYLLGGQNIANQSLREAIVSTVKAPLRRIRKDNRPQFWALDDVSFDVKFGEVVGLIGRNGAGKSTLLKILSRITSPTQGRITLYGRVGSLLEVGTGFHPELSGRENIYMNGAILGMKHDEIKQKFDEIVEFAEIAKFIDTAVKFYSSGMYLRLAFAVAAHLETEILLVDEVLAVGDIAFQRKCLNKMESVSHQGRTVILVSHNIAAIRRLCSRSLLLNAGSIIADGPTDSVINTYMDVGSSTNAERIWTETDTPPKTEYAQLKSIRIKDDRGNVTIDHDIRNPVRIEVEYEVVNPGKHWAAYFRCNNDEGTCVFFSGQFDEAHLQHQSPDFVGCRLATCTIPGNFLAEGSLSLDVGIYALHEFDTHYAIEYNAVMFQVHDPMTGDSARGIYPGIIPGVVRPILMWDEQEFPEV